MPASESNGAVWATHRRVRLRRLPTVEGRLPVRLLLLRSLGGGMGRERKRGEAKGEGMEGTEREWVQPEARREDGSIHPSDCAASDW